MTVTVNGTTGVSLVQDSTITSAKIVDGTIAPADLATASLPVGVSQTLQSVTRTSGTPYTNSTGRPIVLYIICTLGTSVTQLTVGAVGPFNIAGNGTGVQVASFIIPDATTYTISDAGTNTHTTMELR